MFALTLEYTSHAGDLITQYMPVYDTMTECRWWADWFVNMLEVLNKTGPVAASCTAVS